jgi:hypothetical protein
MIYFFPNLRQWKINQLMEKDTFEEIAGLIKAFNSQLEQYIPALQTEVEQIIATGNTSNQIIEGYLDTLLSLTMHSTGNKLFVSLLEYYKTIDPEGAMFYWKEYDKQD